MRLRKKTVLRYAWLGLAVLLILPFIVERSVSVYTDGDRIAEPEETAVPALRQILWNPPLSVGDVVNAPDTDEYEPRLSPHGDQLVFTRGRPGENAELYVSQRIRGRWTAPEPLEVNTEADEMGASFSADGGTLYFYSNREGGVGGYDLWRAPLTEEGTWGEAENLGAEVNSTWNEMSPVTDEHGRLYFTSDRRSKEGGTKWNATMRSRLRPAEYDIWVARAEKADGEGSSAQAFGDAKALLELSRFGSAEGTVSVSPFGDFLYFASNRAQSAPAEGEGGFDLFRVRLDDGSVFGEPEH
ncbi:MAG: hypothetical protein AAF517_14910 [Planctomycetota bacterium]